MHEEKTPEDVFRARYALSPNKLFQEAVWGLVQSGMTVKEAERIVGEQVMVKESRHRVPVGQPQSKLSFAEESTPIDYSVARHVCRSGETWIPLEH